MVPNLTAMHDEIEIPAGLGARMFLNEDGGITITQCRGEEEEWLILALGEVEPVVTALRELVATAKAHKCQQAGTTTGGTGPA